MKKRKARYMKMYPARIRENGLWMDAAAQYLDLML